MTSTSKIYELLTSPADLGCKPANQTKPFQGGSLGLRLTSPNVQCSLQAEGIIQHLEGLFHI